MNERIDSSIFYISMIGFAIAFFGFFFIKTCPYLSIIGASIALSFQVYRFLVVPHINKSKNRENKK